MLIHARVQPIALDNSRSKDTMSVKVISLMASSSKAK